MSPFDSNVQRAASLYGPAAGGFGAQGTGPQYEKWKSLSHYILEWFYEPDLEALRMAYSVICAHFTIPDKPAWYFLLGDSGTGKTALAIEPCKKINRVQLLSDVSPRSFISGFSSNNRANVGILQKGDKSKSMIWLFQDFTSMISMNPDDLMGVAKVFREVWDGSTSRDTANTGKFNWSGRVTCLAAGTPAIERYWARYRHLGERFVTFRWNAPQNRSEAAKWVLKQAPYRDVISRTLIDNVYSLFDNSWLSERAKNHSFESLPDDFISALADSASLVSLLQTPVERDMRNMIRYVGNPEFPSRLIAAVQYMVKGHMMLMGKCCPDTAELKIAKRLLLDSIPIHRRKILDAMPLDETPTNRLQLCQKSGVPKASLYAEVDELVQLKVMDMSDGKSEPAVTWSKSFLDQADAAKLILKVS